MMFVEVHDLGTPKCVQQHIQSLDLQLIHLLCQALRPLSLLLAANFSVLHHEPGQYTRELDNHHYIPNDTVLHKRVKCLHTNLSNWGRSNWHWINILVNALQWPPKFLTQYSLNFTKRNSWSPIKTILKFLDKFCRKQCWCRCYELHLRIIR